MPVSPHLRADCLVWLTDEWYSMQKAEAKAFFYKIRHSNQNFLSGGKMTSIVSSEYAVILLLNINTQISRAKQQEMSTSF